MKTTPGGGAEEHPCAPLTPGGYRARTKPPGPESSRGARGEDDPGRRRERAPLRAPNTQGIQGPKETARVKPSEAEVKTTPGVGARASWFAPLALGGYRARERPPGRNRKKRKRVQVLDSWSSRFRHFRQVSHARNAEKTGQTHATKEQKKSKSQSIDPLRAQRHYLAIITLVSRRGDGRGA